VIQRRHGQAPRVALLVLALALAAGPATAAEVRGRVVDPSGDPVPGVLVTIPELALSVVSEADGGFLLEGIPEGSYVLATDGAGTVRTRLPVTVPSPAPVEIMVFFADAVKEGKKQLERDRRAEAASGPDVSAKDAGGVKVQLLCTNCNAAGLTMLGLTEDHLAFDVDGIPIHEGIQAVWVLSMLPAEAVARTNIMPGPGSVFTGSDGLAGGMETIRRDPFGEEGAHQKAAFHAKLVRGSFDLWSEELYAAGPFTKNIAGDIVLTHSTSDPINPNGDDRNEQGKIDRDTLDARLAFRFGDRSRLTVGMYHFDEDQWRGPGSVVRFQAGGETIQRWWEEDIPIYHRVVSANWGHEFGNGAILEARAARSNRHQQIWEYAPNDKENTYDLLFDVHADFDYATIIGGGHVGSRWFLEGGVEYQEEKVDVFNAAELIPTQRYVHDVVEGLSGFAQGTVGLPGRVTLVLGLRRDDFGEFGAAWNPRVGVRWKPLEDLYISAEVGGSYRPPWSVFAEVCCGNRYQSNTEVRSETGRAVHLALAWYPTQRLKVTFAAQHAEFDDLIIHGVTGGAGFNAVYRNLNVPESRVTGAEAGLTMRFDRLTFGGSYGLVDSNFSGDITTLEQTMPGVFEEVVVLPDGQGRLPYIKDDNASLFVTWVGPKWDGRINADYFGHDWIQKLKDFDTPGFPDYMPGTDVLPVLIPTPSYLSLNMEGGWTYNRWRFFAGIDNLLDEYQDDFADATTSAKWGLQRGRFFYGGFSFDL